MHQVILLLGSNLYDPIQQLHAARELIYTELGSIDQMSRIYETEPWGLPDQPTFLNQALRISTALKPLELLREIKQIEVTLGRLPAQRWTARIIDIDIILYDDIIVDEPALSIPHPRFHERNFALIPILEVAEDWIHPLFNVNMDELYLKCSDTCEVYLLD